MRNRALRRELSDFLRSRRARLTPESVGLPRGPRRRTPGLRREEVAELAGVGIAWYTWLEQGRDVNASDQVLNAIARALRLDEMERDYLFSLAHGTRYVPLGTHLTPPGAEYESLLDALEPNLAFVFNWRWDLLAWNQSLGEAFHLDGSELVGSEERNMLWLVFARPEARELFCQWPHRARHAIATFRHDSALRSGGVDCEQLVEALSDVSPEFRSWWPNHDVEECRGCPNELKLPGVGRLKTHSRVAQLDMSHDIRLVVFMAPPGGESNGKLRRLSEGRDEGSQRRLESLSADVRPCA